MRTAILVVLALVLAGCGGPGDEPDSVCSEAVLLRENVQVRLETTLGDITAELFADKAPTTASNFAAHARDGHYDDVPFHRIITDFMMQGGDFTQGTGGGGRAHEGCDPDGDGNIPDEFHPDLSHEGPGYLSMANAGAGTGGSQFFITFRATPHLDPYQNGELKDCEQRTVSCHPVFGRVVEGMDVVERVNAEAASPNGQPRTPVILERATVIDDPLEPTPQEPAEVSGDLITPGTWHITNTDDSVLAWARNTGGASADVAFTVTGPDGGDLPDGWAVVAGEPEGALRGGGMRHTLLHVSVPNGTSGTFDLELRTGHSTTPITADVELVHDRVSQVGDSITAQYAGTCKADGQAFDDGRFPLTLGGGKAIVGFDLGLVGLGLEEEARLVLPAPMAYGEKGGPCADKENADLVFDVQIVSFDD